MGQVLDWSLSLTILEPDCGQPQGMVRENLSLLKIIPICWFVTLLWLCQVLAHCVVDHHEKCVGLVQSFSVVHMGCAR